MSKKDLTEAEIRSRYITPALRGVDGSKWDFSQIREEYYFTQGRVIVRGRTIRRGEANKADYLLFYKKNLPLAVIEAKDNNHSVGDGPQQALDYAPPFAYCFSLRNSQGTYRVTNGREILFRLGKKTFPTPKSKKA